MENEKFKEEQKKFMELQIIDQQTRKIQDELLSIDQQAAEVSAAVESISELENVKEQSEILVPLINGIFVKAEIKETKKMLVNVGQGTLVTKKPDEVKKLLENQINELISYRDNLLVNLQSLLENASRIEDELNQKESHK
jgi:prefoldin alpha subunit